MGASYNWAGTGRTGDSAESAGADGREAVHAGGGEPSQAANGAPPQPAPPPPASALRLLVGLRAGLGIIVKKI